MTQNTYNANANWTAPAWTTTVQVEIYGSGGGGAGSNNATSGASGGGGGAYVRSNVAVTAGNVYAIVIGTVGSGGSANAAGGNATASTFNATTVVAAGGKGGAHQGGAAGAGGAIADCTGDVKYNGGSGFQAGVQLYGGGGGAGGNNTGNAANATAQAGATGAGGGGSGGNGGNNNTVGNAGVAPGGGGGGGGARSTGRAGGAGALGRVILTYSSPVSIEPGYANAVLTGYAPVFAKTDHQSVEAGVGALTLTGYAPDVSALQGTIVEPPFAAATLTGYAPTVEAIASVSVTPGFGAVTLTGYAPTVRKMAVFSEVRRAILDGLSNTVGSEWNTEKANLPVTDVVRTSDTVVTITLSALSGYDISVAETVQATVPAAALAGAAAVVATPTFGIQEINPIAITATVASLLLHGFAPDVAVSSAQEFTPGVAAVTITSYAPTVTAVAGAEVTPGVAQLTLTAYAATITVPQGQYIEPSVGTLTLTGYAPTVRNTAVFAEVRRAILDGLANTVGAEWDTEKANFPVTDVVRTSDTVVTITLSAVTSYNITSQETVQATVPAAALAGATQIIATPTFTIAATADVVVDPGFGALTLTGFAPTVAAQADITPSVGTLTLTGYAPTISLSANIEITPSLGELSLTGYVPTVSAIAGEVSVVPGVAVLTLTSYAPTVRNVINFSDVRRGILNGLANTVGTEWDLEKANLPETDVVRTSDTVVTITLSALPNFDSTGTETVRATVPANALAGGVQRVATPTFNIAGVADVRPTPGVAVLVLTGYAPTAVGSIVVQSATINTWSLVAQGIQSDVTYVPGVGELSLTGYPPGVPITDVGGTPGVAAVSLTGYPPTVALSNYQVVTPTLGSILLTGYAPDVVALNPFATTTGLGELTFTGYAPTITAAGVWMTPGTALLYLGRRAAGVTAAMLGDVGMGAFNAANCLDGNTASVGWNTDTAVLGSLISIDFGAGNAKNLCGLRLYLSDTYAGVYELQYSDDNVYWYPALSNITFTTAGWHGLDFQPVGAKRYWALVLTNTPGAGGDITEFELYQAAGYPPDVFVTGPIGLVPGPATITLTGYAPFPPSQVYPGYANVVVSGYAPTIAVRRTQARAAVQSEAVRLPPPAPRYDGQNEAQFRRVLEQWMTTVNNAKEPAVTIPEGDAVSEPVGGTVVDAEARDALNNLLASLRAAGLLAE